MVLNIILACVVSLSIIILFIISNKLTKILEGNKGFWIKVFANTAAISIPPMILSYVWIIGNISQIAALTIRFYAILVVILLLMFLVNLIGWKLKNRNVMMLTTILAVLILFINARVSSSLIPYVIANSLKKYDAAFTKLEQYKNENGMYPQEADIEIKNAKYNNFYYKTFNDGKEYALYVAVGQSLWSHCSDFDAEQCYPNKWLFEKDGSLQWIEIPEWLVVRKLGNSKNGKWSDWFIDRVSAKENNNG